MQFARRLLGLRGSSLSGLLFSATKTGFRSGIQPRTYGQSSGTGRRSLMGALNGESAFRGGSLASGLGLFSTLSAASVLGEFKEMGLVGWLLVDAVLNLGGWAVAATLKTEKFYDLIGSTSFLVLAAGSWALNGWQAPRKILATAMVTVWAVRLGSYLVARVHKVGKDSRFDEVKHQPGMFLFYWTMQAIWVFVTLSPVLIINCQATVAPLRYVDIVGACLWAVGLGIEAVADWQKDRWRSRPENKGRFIDEGLWSVSRHPNYLGEMMLWWGVFFVCAGGFSKAAQYASVASPLVVFLLLRYVSGVPILERQADQRWGQEPEYQAYKARVPVLFPTLDSILGTGKASKGNS